MESLKRWRRSRPGAIIGVTGRVRCCRADGTRVDADLRQEARHTRRGAEGDPFFQPCTEQRHLSAGKPDRFEPPHRGIVGNPPDFEPTEDQVCERLFHLCARWPVEQGEGANSLLRNVLEHRLYSLGMATTDRSMGKRQEKWLDGQPKHLVLSVEVLIERRSSDTCLPSHLADAQLLVPSAKNQTVERGHDPPASLRWRGSAVTGCVP